MEKCVANPTPPFSLSTYLQFKQTKPLAAIHQVDYTSFDALSQVQRRLLKIDVVTLLLPNYAEEAKIAALCLGNCLSDMVLKCLRPT